jgi:hypothetical protein
MLWADDGGGGGARTTIPVPALHAAVGSGASLGLDRRHGPAPSTSYGSPTLDELGHCHGPRLGRRHGHIGHRPAFASLTSAHRTGGATAAAAPSAVLLPVIPVFASATPARARSWRRGQAQFVSLPIGVGSGEFSCAVF